MSCIFPEDVYGAAYYDCLGNCLNDADGDGTCDEAEVNGCVYEEACNFNPDATEDDGSCEYESCAGCMQALACNFDSTATIDAGCLFPIDLYGTDNVDCDGNNNREVLLVAISRACGDKRMVLYRQNWHYLITPVQSTQDCLRSILKMKILVGFLK